MRQNGAVVLPLSEVLDNLLAGQGNSMRSHYMGSLIHAKWAWKELLRTTVYSITHHVVDVVDGRVILPGNIGQMLSISTVDDCNNLQPLAHNPNINTHDLSIVATTSCKCKGQDTLCDLVDSIIYRTEQMEINGETYPKKIWNSVDACGELREITETPVYNSITDEVEYITTHTRLCEVEVTDDGCLKKTPENELVVRQHCGCFMLSNCCATNGTRIPSSISPFGTWTWEANSSSVIHLRDVTASKLIITAQGNGDCSAREMMVPEFAVDALMWGIMHRQAAFSPIKGINEKRHALNEYRRVRYELVKHLNRFDPEAFMELGGIIPKWGGL